MKKEPDRDAHAHVMVSAHSSIQSCCYSTARRKLAGPLPPSLITATGLLLSLSSCVQENISPLFPITHTRMQRATVCIHMWDI